MGLACSGEGNVDIPLATEVEAACPHFEQNWESACSAIPHFAQNMMKLLSEPNYSYAAVVTYKILILESYDHLIEKFNKKH